VTLGESIGDELRVDCPHHIVLTCGDEGWCGDRGQAVGVNMGLVGHQMNQFGPCPGSRRQQPEQPVADVHDVQGQPDGGKQASRVKVGPVGDQGSYSVRVADGVGQGDVSPVGITNQVNLVNVEGVNGGS
jgi:hypothetical protein